MESPKYVQTSLAAAMTLGFTAGRFRRDAQLTGLNLLLTYQDGCVGRCSYCGLSRGRELTAEDRRTFIRVRWPTYPLDEIIARTRTVDGQLQRICVSMITHRRAFADLNTVVTRLHQKLDLPISALIAPTLLADPGAMLAETRAAGADMAGVAIDAATPELFDRHRRNGVGGPHRWEHYWRTVEEAVGVFGPYRVGVHLIVGLGETEREMIETIQRAHDLGAHTHLFSFFPEGGTPVDDLPQPGYGQYRRVQLARYVINHERGRAEAMRFNAAGQVVDFGLEAEEIKEIVADGSAFMTSGCPGRDDRVACNRPFGNERPSRPIRNYPFPPGVEDVALIRLQLREGLMEG
ncbi:MAG: radical SAM protein [Chloroflexota bacterium]|nr:radical SAM protein [Chloroflexota bacterium]